MAEPEKTRNTILEPFETIFAKVCLEWGWATRAEIADWLRGRHEAAAAREKLVPPPS
jgi:hypothetical protein